MTKKRFKIDYSDESIINTFTKQYYPTDDINGVEDICDLLNEQHETIQRLEAQLSHLEYRFFEYRNKAKGLPKDKVKETLQKRYNHLQKTQQETEKPPRYWQGAIMEVEVIADCLGVDLND